MGLALSGRKRGRRPKKLGASLARMETAELIRRLAEPELTYLFKHTLVQEATYTSLTRHDRKRLHEMIAHVLETEAGADIDAVSAQLAHHYTEAGDDVKTFQYALCAGNVATRVYAREEALANYALALKVAPEIATGNALIQLYTRRGRMLELAGRYEDALTNYQDMETTSHRRGDAALELEALMLRATLLAVGTRVRDWSQSNRVSQQALTLAAAANNRPAQARIFWNLLLANRFAEGGLERAIAFAGQSIGLAQALGLSEQLALTLKDTCIAHMRAGQFDAVPEMAEQAVGLLRELDDKPMLAEMLGVKTLLHFSRGDLENAREHGQEAYAINQAIDNPHGQNVIGLWLPGVYRELGQLNRCLALAAQSIAYFEQSGYWDMLWDMRPVYGWWLGGLGAVEEGIEYTERAGRQSHESAVTMVTNAVLARLLLLRGEIQAARRTLLAIPLASFQDYLSVSATPPGALAILLAYAELALAEGNPAQVLDLTGELLPLLEQSGLKIFGLEVLVLRAQAFRAQEDVATAHTILRDTLAQANLMHARWIEWQILDLLVEIETTRENFETAQAARRQAHSIVEYIAAHTPVEYRTLFLNLPRVRAIRRNELTDVQSN